MRATPETLAPGSSDAATSRSFSSCDHRRRRSTDVITSALEIVIALLLGLPLGPAAFASVKQGGPQRRNTVVETRRHDERRHHGGSLSPRSEPANNHAFLPRATAQGALRSIVDQTDLPIMDQAGEAILPLEQVVDR